MKIKFLFPHRYKAIGWLIAIPCFILMIIVMHFDFAFKFLEFRAKGLEIISDNRNFLWNLHSHNFTGEVVGILLVIGLLLIAYSKEKQEDEWIAKLRLESMLWAVYINAALLILSILFFYNFLFLNIMVYNICTPVVLFIVRFNLLMYIERKKLNREEL